MVTKISHAQSGNLFFSKLLTLLIFASLAEYNCEKVVNNLPQTHIMKLNRFELKDETFFILVILAKST